MFRILCIFALWIGWFGHHPIRGKSVAPSIISMTDATKKTDNMPKKLTQEEFVAKVKERYGDMYDCREVVYVNTKTPIKLFCKKHGEFEQIPHSLLLGHGCQRCGKERQGGGVHLKGRKLVFGVGINDVDFSTGKGTSRLRSYILWKSILRRCYGKTSRKSASYEGCSVCKEWKRYSVFKEWYDRHYVEGYHIDKDILISGNKVYSPDACSFVPPEINTLIVKHNATRGDLPIGVSRLSDNAHRYRAIVRIYKKYVTIGIYDTPEEAFNAYKTKKETHIQEMAKKYFNGGKINYNVYCALMNYRVEITD